MVSAPAAALEATLLDIDELAGATELGAIELAMTELAATELGAVELGATELGATELGATELAAIELGTGAGDWLLPPPPPHAVKLRRTIGKTQVLIEDCMVI